MSLHRALPFLVLTLLAGLTTAQDRDGLVPYEVKPGDTCWNIAERLFGDGEKYGIIHEHNTLGPMPHILTPGETLWLPAAATKPEARLQSPRKDVRVRPPRTPDWREGYEDMELWRLFRVATGEGSSARILFRDDSHLRMRELALLVIHGGSVADARLRRRPGAEIRLEKGTLRGGLARMDAETDVQITTPSARVALRSEEAQIEVAEDEATFLSVYQGDATLAGLVGEEVTVPAEFGASVEKGSPPSPPRRLLPAPAWQMGATEVVVLTPEGFPAQFEASWGSVDGAQRYRFELARDERFRVIVADAVVGAGILSFRAEELAPGTYRARVAAIDEGRLEGRASKSVVFHVVETNPERRLRHAEDNGYEVVGLLSLPPPAVDLPLEVSVDGAPFRPFTEHVRIAIPGPHVIEARTSDGASRALKVRVLGLRGRIVLPDEGLKEGDPAAQVIVAIEDERGMPAAPPGLRLTAEPGGQLPLGVASAGRFVGALAIPPGVDEIELEAAWAMGELASLDAPVVRSSPRPPAFPWPYGPPAAEWAQARATVPSAPARSVTRLGVSAACGGREDADGDDTVVFRTAVSGELAWLDGRVGADIEVPWFNGPVHPRSTANSVDFGPIRVGARGIVLDEAGVTLAPSLRVRIPTRQTWDERFDVLLEPALLVEWRPVAPLVVTSGQGLLVNTDLSDSTGLHYSATWGAGVELAELVQLGAELDTVLGIAGFRSSRYAVALSGNVRFLLDRFRIGVFAGGGLNPDGRDTFGRFTAGLTADIGFPGL